jgi:hypothetical protein
LFSANALALPPVLLIITPLARLGTSPRAAAYSWKLWCMIAVPCVAVSMRVRRPIRPAAGIVNSRWTWPVAVVHADQLALAVADQLHHAAHVLLGDVDDEVLDRLEQSPGLLVLLMITCGLLMLSS